MTKTSTVSLFDLLLKPKPVQRVSQVVKPVRVEPPPKKFNTKRRRKQLSTFKKKLLLERWEHAKLMLDVLDEDLRVLSLVGFVAGIEDEDERAETIANARDLVRLSGKTFDVILVGDDIHCVFSRDDSKAVAIAANTLRGVILGGEPLQLRLLSDDQHDQLLKNPSSSSGADSDQEVKGGGAPDWMRGGNSGDRGCYVLRVHGMVTGEDVRDEEEALEVLRDIRSLLAAHNALLAAVWIESSPSPPLLLSSPIESALCPCQRWAPELILLEITSLKGLSLFLLNIGSPAIYGIYDNQAYSQHMYSKTATICVKIAVYDLCLLGFVDNSQLEDKDEAEEVCANILTLSQHLASTVQEISFRQTSGNAGLCDAVLRLNCLSVAERLVELLTTTHVAGAALSIELYAADPTDESVNSSICVISPGRPYPALMCAPASGTADTLPTPSELMKTARDFGAGICRLASLHALRRNCPESNAGDEEPMVACAGFHTRAAAEDAMLFLEGRVIGGSAVRVEVWVLDDDDAGERVVVANSNVPDSPFEDKKIPEESAHLSKYKVAATAAKIPKHVTPSLDWQLAIPRATEEVEAAVKVLLRALAGFQERLREREPLNYKHKLRFVLGMKQATSSVKLGRTRLLLLAPDTEAAELIDDRLGALVSLASDNGVPVLFCLGRRRLGKAVCSSMKQSVVAVRDPDGAYDAFKSIVAFIRVCIEESSKRKAEGAPTVEVNCDVRKSEEMLKP